MSEVRLFAPNFSPRNWAYCNGQLLAIASNTALFSLLGTTYGGDGRTTFALPDLRGRTPLSPGQSTGSNYVLGQRSGVPTVTLLSSNLPSHTHALTGSPTITVKPVCSTTPSGSSEPQDGSVPAPPGGGMSVFGSNGSDPLATYNLNPASNLIASVSGNSYPVTLGSPALGINYIICMYGIFPSRD